MANTATNPRASALPNALLEARGLTKDYGAFRAVHGVEFDIPDNCFVTILGPSGCGKTTILRMIGGFESVTSGSLTLMGEPLMGVLPYERPINTVFQNYALFPHLRVKDNVAFGLRLRKLSRADVAMRVERALETVQMESMADRYPSQLSGGQQQRIALARAFVNEPKLLLLDEPLGALDLKMRRHMQVELKDLQQRLAMSFLYVTHDQEEAFALSDLIIVMHGGRIEQIGSPEQIYHEPANAYVADFIGGANLVPGTVAHAADGRATIETVLGKVETLASPTVTQGEPACLCIRAEDTRPQTALSPDAGDCLSFNSTVTHVVFQGSGRLVEAEASGQKIVARLGHDTPVELGQSITLAVPLRKVRIVHGAPPEGGSAL